MATLRETIQAQIDGHQRSIDGLRQQLLSADPGVQALLGADVISLQTLFTTWPDIFRSTSPQTSSGN